jgi:hypothetical protein
MCRPEGDKEVHSCFFLKKCLLKSSRDRDSKISELATLLKEEIHSRWFSFKLFCSMMWYQGIMIHLEAGPLCVVAWEG